jgi:hypothetical protein
LRQPDFLKILAGETISDLGSHVGGLALPLAAALVLQASPGQMAALRAAEYMPRILIGLVAGVWVDRLPRRPLLLATNIVRALLLLLVALAAAFGWLRIEVLYVVGIVMAALRIVLGGALAEASGSSAAIVVGVLGGLISFVWVWRSPIRRL